MLHLGNSEKDDITELLDTLQKIFGNSSEDKKNEINEGKTVNELIKSREEFDKSIEDIMRCARKR